MGMSLSLPVSGHYKSGLCFLLLLASGAVCPLPASAAQQAPPRAEREVSSLFREEMQQAVVKLKWRGERLSDDTLYAVALTGASWELAWGKEHLFSLAWGDARKVSTLGKRDSRNYISLTHEIQDLYAHHDYRKAVDVAFANFSLDEIGCDVFLKEPVGASLVALGQPEQAFPIFAAPFEPPRSLNEVPELNRRFREDALDAAARAGLTREAVAFALSLLLEPGTDAPAPHGKALAFLEKTGVDVDRVLLGILQAPEKLRGLPFYQYAAADLLAYRASPRLMPFLMHLVNSDDVYLRSRALIGLGIVSYQARPNDPPGWAGKIIAAPLREYGLSSGQRKLIFKEIQEGIASDKYRVRASAALALALAGDEESVPLLQKLAKDRAYTLTSLPTAPVNARIRRVQFPVRQAVSAGLERYGISAPAGGGDMEGRALDTARQGGQDETNDRRNLRRDSIGQIVISPLDSIIALPQENGRK